MRNVAAHNPANMKSSVPAVVSKWFDAKNTLCKISVKSNGSVSCSTIHRGLPHPHIVDVWESGNVMYVLVTSNGVQYTADFRRPPWVAAAIKRFNATKVAMETCRAC